MKAYPELFALENDSDSCSSTDESSHVSDDSSTSSEDEDQFDSQDECLDQGLEAYSLGDYTRSQSNPNKRQ